MLPVDVAIKKKQYKCSICDFNCTNYNGLYKHLMIHENNKKFQCFICEAKFLQKFNLQQHVKIHFKIKEFL